MEIFRFTKRIDMKKLSVISSKRLWRCIICRERFYLRSNRGFWVKIFFASASFSVVVSTGTPFLFNLLANWRTVQQYIHHAQNPDPFRVNLTICEWLGLCCFSLDRYRALGPGISISKVFDLSVLVVPFLLKKQDFSSIDRVPLIFIKYSHEQLYAQDYPCCLSKACSESANYQVTYPFSF